MYAAPAQAAAVTLRDIGAHRGYAQFAPLTYARAVTETHYGIEIATEALEKSSRFCRETAMPLEIFCGDMRHIPFASETFSFVYAFNAIFFMTKPDIARAMGEMERVLRPGGLIYVNFISIDEPDKGPFCETAPARLLLKSERFAQHEDDEPDAYFQAFEIQRKEKRFEDKVHGGGRSLQVYIEYIARKG